MTIKHTVENWQKNYQFNLAHGKCKRKCSKKSQVINLSMTSTSVLLTMHVVWQKHLRLGITKQIYLFGYIWPKPILTQHSPKQAQSSIKISQIQCSNLAQKMKLITKKHYSDIMYFTFIFLHSITSILHLLNLLLHNTKCKNKSYIHWWKQHSFYCYENSATSFCNNR